MLVCVCCIGVLLLVLLGMELSKLNIGKRTCDILVLEICDGSFNNLGLKIIWFVK